MRSEAAGVHVDPATPSARLGIAARAPELLILLIGVALRTSFLENWEPTWGYDYPDHIACVDWYATHLSLPPITLSRAAYHPPLYHFLAGLAARAGAGPPGLLTISVALGVARLGLLLVGLERLFPNRPGARRFALALGVVLPASLQIDGMITNEGLLTLLAWAAILAMPWAFAGDGRGGWWRGAALGVLVGLAVLTKFSALALVLAVGMGAAVEVVVARGARERGARVLRWSGFALALVVVDGWYFAHNVAAYGQAMPTGYDRGDEQVAMEAFRDVPLRARRAPSFYFGYTRDIYESPYTPSGVRPVPMFWPTVVASTFVDFYNYRFAGTPDFFGEPFVWKNNQRVPERVIGWSRGSVVGGTVLALAVVIAWLVAARSSWRRRAAWEVAALSVPLLVVAGQLYFAVRFPIDEEGPIKGVYMQLAAPPLCALAGLAWEAARRARHVGPQLALLLGLALGAVGAYDFACRFHV